IEDDKEKKLREFKRLIFTNALEKYGSSILILTEELKNISRFGLIESEEVVGEIQKKFAAYSDRLLTTIKATDLEPQYVPLFVNYEKYSAHAKLANRKLSAVYEGIKELGKN